MRCVDPEASERMVAEIDAAKEAGDTAGGYTGSGFPGASALQDVAHVVKTVAISLGDDALASESATADLIVNCTTIGMAHGPDESGTPLGPEHIPSTALVNDLVYNPLETPLLRAAAKAGARVLGGIHMLVYQGAASFEMWTGRQAPVAVMLEAATKAMAAR